MKALKLEAGVYMDSKEELLEAIEHYDVLTKKQRQVLRVLTELEENEIATITTSTLASASNITPGAVHKTIKLFKEKNYLKNIENPGRKIYKFKLNLTKLEEVRDIYRKQKKYLKNTNGI
jgi:DNA-binding MarR family transcriptional regulator